MSKNKLTKILVIVGPTASGKSDLGIKLAKKYDGEIISADSRQVYRGMDIGTGKIKKDNPSYNGRHCHTVVPIVISDKIVHHLIDVADPKKQFTANDFKKLGEKAIINITSRYKLPIVVGGTGFYIDVLLGRIAIVEVPPNKKLREHFDKLSAEHLFKMLRKLDPRRAKNIDKHNKRRLIRALEIVLVSPKPKVQRQKSKIKFKVLWLGINPGKDMLAKKIKERLEQRLRQGMIKEVEKLHKKGISWKRLDDFGLEYRWISRYLCGLASKKEMKENLYRDIIKYSKRQMTWFTQPHPWEKNSPKKINWIISLSQAQKLVRKFLK